MHNINKIIPSIITLGNLGCGFLAIAYIADGRLNAAAALIFVGMLFDMLDGKVARLTHGSSDFGSQLDSLSDMITFGVTPAFLVKAFLESPPVCCNPRLAWIVGLCFVACAALRLARFNVQNDHDESAHIYFKGLATPAAAGLLSSYVLMADLAARFLPESYYKLLVLLNALIVPALMVCNLRYVHMGTFLLKRRNMTHSVAFFVLFVLAVIVEPQVFPIAMCCTFLAYALSGPANFCLQSLAVREENPEPDVA